MFVDNSEIFQNYNSGQRQKHFEENFRKCLQTEQTENALSQLEETLRDY